jgi:hypothetical protein
LQQVIITALVAASVALTTSLITAYVTIRGQKIQDANNGINSKLNFLTRKVEALEKIKNEISNTKIEEGLEKQELAVKAGIIAQDIYFKRLSQIQSIDHYFDISKLNEVSKNRTEIIDYFARLKVLTSKDKKEALKSKELKSMLEEQPWTKMVKEINDIESLISSELKETISQISKLLKNG